MYDNFIYETQVEELTGFADFEAYEGFLMTLEDGDNE